MSGPRVASGTVTAGPFANIPLTANSTHFVVAVDEDPRNVDDDDQDVVLWVIEDGEDPEVFREPTR